MSRVIELKVPHDRIQDEFWIRQRIAEHMELSDFSSIQYHILRRNIDARSTQVVYVLKIEVAVMPEKLYEKKLPQRIWPPLKNIPAVVIVGAGPCGYFAALHLLSKGIKPIVIDRGKDVQQRRRDLKAIQQDSVVHPDSNYCFGEGGAGTYSDGKLYTRSVKRGDVQNVLTWLVQHGASEEILVEAHPHIGSNKLPGIIQNIRKTIEQQGGEVRFECRLEDMRIKDKEISAAITNLGSIDCKKIILATGHSARDIYTLLKRKNILIEYKDFALGVRIEHPQLLIDQMQYHCKIRPLTLPAASYSLSTQVDGKGVFSFCMCPGGLIIPAATAPGEIVLNGMSLSRRDSPYANSGLVTSVDALDFKPFSREEELQAMFFQSSVERKMFAAGDGSQKAPAQKLVDFVSKKSSSFLPGSSYIPGTFSADLNALLPEGVAFRLRSGLREIGKRIKSYLSEESVLLATESRTSAPVRIPRDVHTCLHPQITGLYPAGEGAGYAGGILSAAMDGIRVAEKISERM